MEDEVGDEGEVGGKEAAIVLDFRLDRSLGRVVESVENGSGKISSAGSEM